MTTTYATTQTVVSGGVLYFSSFVSPFSSFIFIDTKREQRRTKTNNRFTARCFARAFPERLFRRRRPLPITKRRIHKMSFFGIGQSKLLSVDVAFATPTRTCVVKSSYTDAMHHVARETLPLITSGTRRRARKHTERRFFDYWFVGWSF